MKRYLLHIGLIGLVILIACDNDHERINREEGNLLINGSFESGSEGWTTFANMSSQITFDTDVPDTGGSLSARITENWGEPFSLTQSVPMTAGQHIIHLSCWGKTEGSDGTFGYNFTNSLELLKAIPVNDTNWTYYSMQDTIDLPQNDTIVVKLQGTFSQLASRSVWFDLCRLELVNP